MSSTVASACVPDAIVARPIANFPPSVWGDKFLKYSEDESERTQLERQVEELKEEVRKELAAAACKTWQQLNLIDAIQRLGVSYHFQEEIKNTIRRIYDSHVNECCLEEEDVKKRDDLYSVALWFRLLRQEGFKVSCDVFDKFKSDGAMFKESLTSDVRGLLSLYEATHLRVHGEDILDEALAFTKAHLKSKAPHLSYPMSEQVCHALMQPLHRGMPRVEARHYFPLYQADVSHNKVILKFAAVDFNLLQLLHKKELSNISRWWKDLDFATKLPFARDRLVECYFWTLGVYFEPKYSLARTILAKAIIMASVVDDIYDAYGTIEELQLFSEAIRRWDTKSKDQLPEYMKIFYEALLAIFDETEKEMTKEGSLYKINYAKDAMKKLIIEGYFKEAEWCNANYVPTLEEYMSVALTSCGYPMVATLSYVGMGEIATKEVFDWISSNPFTMKACELICRLTDDLTSNEFEQEREHVASAVECYIKQYGTSDEEAREELNKIVVDAWKDINQACLSPTEVPFPFLLRILNLTRVMDVLYKGDDNYTRVGEAMKAKIASLIIDPVVI